MVVSIGERGGGGAWRYLTSISRTVCSTSLLVSHPDPCIPYTAVDDAPYAAVI